jgi:hypothetical protein
VFAEVKALLRRAAERTVNQLWQTFGKWLDEIPAQEYRNYFENTGYVSN